MQYPVYSPVTAYTPGTSITYGTGAVVAEAVSASVSWERADGRFYGDDVQLDSDNGVLGYTIDFEPTGLTNAGRELLLGEAKASDEYTITDAPSPDVGFGYIRVMRDKGEVSYEGWWYYKVKFGLGSEETRTKEQNIEWRTPTLNGVGSGVQLAAGANMSFAVHQDFDTMAAARTWLKTKAGIT
jgi:hypothetical protein